VQFRRSGSSFCNRLVSLICTARGKAMLHSPNQGAPSRRMVGECHCHSPGRRARCHLAERHLTLEQFYGAQAFPVRLGFTVLFAVGEYL
jgi:hypothetical protein